ncbi:hypothetical protein B484DRAFT_448907 [Ochromonadaceae sp. CCMP2298]|nr:hypothetical protein B484DRAFT_448907 [Ochromonadaceae sp. CCMP2298]|mmetsp:Transcript_5490/g.12107  ORF Transcript_5490/g.12107 Transcript_5490/m.12107 type:complete len:419 (+) Transcript_5490:123-1379(+)
MEFADKTVDDDNESGTGSDSQDICTFALTGTNLVTQPVFICDTCSAGAGTGTEDLLCCCSGCAATCHDGHNVRFLAHGKAYCDCHTRCCELLEHSASECARRNMTLGDIGRKPPIEMLEVHSAALEESAQIADQCRLLASLSHETFWIDGDAEPRCSLERIALDVYRYHVDRHSLPSGGCEFWTQVKKASKGVDLHYDKDEEIAALMEIGVYPCISTVTYLTEAAGSAPTIVFKRGADTDIDDPIDTCGIVFPSIGKHLAFNGAFLHGAPSVLRSVEQVEEEEGEEDETDEWRITFLVNVWVGHQPCGVFPLTEDILQSLDCLSLGLQLGPGDAPVVIKITQENVAEASEITIPFLSNKGVDWTIEEDECALNVTMHVPRQIYQLPGSYLIEYDESTCAHFSTDDGSDEGGGSEEEDS